MNKYFTCRTIPVHLMLAGFFSLGLGNALAETAPLSAKELELHNDLRLAPVVVTATRIEQNSFDLPMSIDSVSGETIREGQLQVNLSESAARVPGVVVNNRNNPAQDLGIQIRGFGSRSAFGVRGVRLYQDGIPLTMPDGQGQTGTFNLDTAKNVEYLRGPFSALYGNSSGGVVQIFTEDGPADPTLSGGVSFGSYGTHRETVTYGGDFDNFNIVVNANTVRSDGYRDQSEFRRDTYHAKIKMQLNEDTKLTVVATALDQPDNDDPQGLTKDEYRADRKQVGPNTKLFNTRVSKSQEHMGATLDHQLTENDSLRFMAYYGQRDNEQFQSIPTGAQNAAGSGGGVQTIEREFGGIDLRWTHTGSLADKPYNFTIGTNVDRMSDDRKGYKNFVGGINPGDGCNVNGRVCGVKGELRRDEVNRLRAFDQYAQGSIDLDPRWNVNVGIRHSKIKFETDDKYFAAGNLDDSGSITYSETTPVVGLIFKATDTLNFYANAGESFETPTFVEAAYKSSTAAGAGLNTDLKAATSMQYEIGAKWMAGDSTIINAALFKIDTDDEIVVQSSAGGRTVYTNAKESERKGFELSIDSKLAYGLSAYLAYTYLDAEFTKDFISGGNNVQSGTDIPGVYKHTMFGELAWKHEPSGFSTAIEGRAFSKSYVSFNPAQGETSGYAIASLRAGLNQSIGKWKFNEFLRVENIFDKEYVGSIRVGDSNGAYYEAAPTRNWLLGLNASYQF
ncbi:Metal-pseudopaline receptor CntO [Methylophilaceae bacterium]|nr:Metal-pseudopaline receptor CntO [Methylophilaceae bacterium]